MKKLTFKMREASKEEKDNFFEIEISEEVVSATSHVLVHEMDFQPFEYDDWGGCTLMGLNIPRVQMPDIFHASGLLHICSDWPTLGQQEEIHVINKKG